MGIRVITTGGTIDQVYFDAADGYHRRCAIYSFHEDAIVRRKIC